MQIRFNFKPYNLVSKLYDVSKRVTGKIWLHTCNRCGYEWTSKTKNPQTCANKSCRSPYWNKERVRPTRKSKK